MVYFSLRESKQNKKGESPIEISISANGERVYFSSGKSVQTNEWNKAKQIVKGKSEQAQLINDYLIQVRNRIYQKEMELIKSGYIVTPTLLRDAYLGRIESLNERTLFQIFAEHNEEQKKLVGNGVSKTTYFISEYTDRLLKEYVKQKYKREDLFLRELNLNFIQSFHTFLKIDKGMAQNSSTKHLRLLKKIINLAVANSYMTYNPFATYKVERELEKRDSFIFHSEVFTAVEVTTNAVYLTISNQ